MIHSITTLRSKSILFAGAMLAVSITAVAGLKAPAETSGLNAEVKHINPLEAQVPSMNGYQLRGRKITFEPGGGTVEHSHKERPGIVMVLSGEITEVRNGEKRIFKAGDTWIEDRDTTHWVVNSSTVPAVIWMVDLPVEG